MRASRSGDLEHAFDLDRRIIGSAATPTVVRACRPLSPNAATIRSDAPFMTFGTVEESRAELMKPPSRTTRATLSRSPSAALSCASRLIAQARAAFWPSSTDTPRAELALGDELALASRQSWPETNSRVPDAHEGDVIGDRARRRRQNDPEIRKFLFHRSGHDALRADASDRAPCAVLRATVFADRQARMQAAAPLRQRGCGAADRSYLALQA